MIKPISLFLILFVGYFTLSLKPTDYNTIKKTIKTDPLYTKGQNIFKRDCASCHYIGMNKIATAPALGGITKLRKKDWLYSYTRNSYKMFEQGDKIAKENISKGWGLMTAFPNLTNSDLDALYYFVEKRYEMSKKGVPLEK